MADPLKRLCHRFRAAHRRLLVRLGLSRLAAITLAVLAVLVATDFSWHFGQGERFVALAVLAAIVALTVVRDLVQPLGRSWSDPEVLRYLDAVLPAGQNRLVVLEELRKEKIAESAWDEGRAMIAQAVGRIESELGRLDLGDAWRREPVRRWQRLAGAALLAGLVAGLLGEFAAHDRYTSIALRRLLVPWAAAPWPSSTWFVLLSPAQDSSVPEGEDLPVRVEVHGRMPTQVSLVYNPTDESGSFTSRKITVGMFVNPDRTAEYTFAKLGDSIRFHVLGGDGRTEPLTIRVIKRPFIREVHAYYKYPPYTGAPPKVTGDLQLSGLEGTEVRLDCTAAVPLGEAWVQLAGQGPEPLPLREDGLHFEWFYLLRDSTTYTIGLKDRHGNREKWAELHRIQVAPDQPPVARIVEPSGDLQVTVRARFKVRYQAAPAAGPQVVYAPYVYDDVAGSSHLSSRVGIQCLESRSGRLIWSREIGSLTPSQFSISSRTRRVRIFGCQPTAKDGVVYHSTNAGVVAALDALSGRILWATRYPHDEEAHDLLKEVHQSIWFSRPPLVREGRVYCTPADSDHLICLEAATGKVTHQLTAKGFGQWGRYGQVSLAVQGPYLVLLSDKDLTVAGPGEVQ